MKQIDLKNIDEEMLKTHATWLAAVLGNGDTLLLEGDLGAGKSTLARAIIQRFMAKYNSIEDVPSPTFTLVQTYEFPCVEIWHADLYRLSDVGEIEELGLVDAFDQAISLIEWPDRLGGLTPQSALHIQLMDRGDTRDLHLSWSDSKWESKLKEAGWA